MSASSIEALASAWVSIAEEAALPSDFEGTASPEAHRACEAIQASLRMEQTLWPEDFERMTREVEQALREADDPNAKFYTNEEVMQAMQERIDRARDKPC